MSFTLLYHLLLLLGLKSLAVLVPAFALAWLTRKQPAMSRHLVWRCAFLVLVTIPLWPMTSIEWQPNLPSTPILRKMVEPVTLHQVTHSIVSESVKTPHGGSITTFRLVQGPKVYGAKPVPLFVWLYLLGLAAVILRLLISALAAAGIYRRSKPIANSELTRLMEKVELGPTQRVRLRVLSQKELCQSPITLRWRGSVVLVPQDMAEWPEQAQRIALLHELAHIRRGDWAVSSLAWLISAFYWFNPLVWVALGHLRQEAERASDDEVLAIGVAPTIYAEELLQIARKLKARNKLCFAVPMARHSQVESRIAAILAIGRKRLRFNRKLASQYAIFTVLLALPLCAFSHFNDFQHDGSGEVVPTKSLSDYQRERIENETYAVPQSLIRAKDFRATLPDGTTVRLLAISDRDKEQAQNFWSPTGGPIQTLNAPAEMSEQIGSGSQEDQPGSKVFNLSLARPKKGDCTVYLADPISKGKLHLDENARASQYLSSGMPFSLTSAVQFHGEKSDRIYAALGQGPWRKVETVAAATAWTRPVNTEPAVRVVKGRLEAQIGQNTRVLTTTAPTEGEVRIRFLDAKGVTVATAGPQLAFEKNPGFLGVDVRGVQKVMIESRPLAWVEFSGIATRPSFVMAPTIKWGTAIDTAPFRMGPIQGEFQGTVEYQQVHFLWRPSAFFTPSRHSWAHYPSPRDADLEQQPGTLIPHTVLLQFAEKASFNDQTRIDTSMEVQDGQYPKWLPAKSENDQGSYSESDNSTSTIQVKRLTFYASPICSQVRLTLRASDLPWVTTNRVPVDLSDINGGEKFQVSGHDGSSAVKIVIPGVTRSRSISTTGMLTSKINDVRAVLVARSGATISPDGSSISDSGEMSLSFTANSLDPSTGQAIKPSDIVAIEFQSRPYNLSKTLEFGMAK